MQVDRVRRRYGSAVKTRRAPSRHCRDASVHGHTTTTMHDIEYTPPRPPSPPVGWVGANAVKHASYCVRELDNQNTVFSVFCFLAVTTAGWRVISFLCGQNLNSAQGG